MRTTLLSLLALTLLASGCTGEPTSSWGFADAPADGKADLPNAGVTDAEYEGKGYQVIAARFKAAGFDTTADVSQLRSIWPLRGDTTAVLNRYGTPILIADEMNAVGFFHTAFDVVRVDSQAGNDEVLAPISGKVQLFDWHGNLRASGIPGYQTIVAIWDPQSHMIVTLMHVSPSAELVRALSDAATTGGTTTFGDEEPPEMSGFVDVRQGEVIGRLGTELNLVAEESIRESFRHTHVDVIDAGQQRTRNPAALLGYKDHVAPTVDSLYVLDQDGRKSDTLKTGKLDLVLEVHDRDDGTPRNLEIGSLAYELYDAQGKVVRRVPRCELEHLFESIKSAGALRAVNLIDFGNMRPQLADSTWPGFHPGNPARTFRYALTQFFVDAAGRCSLYSDADGFVNVAASQEQLGVRVQIWDQNGNLASYEAELTR